MEAEFSFGVQQIIRKKRIVQALALGLIAFTLVGTYYSLADAQSWVAKDQIHVPLEEPVRYVADKLQSGENVMVLCAFNLFSADMVRFYLFGNPNVNAWVYQYPDYPVDTYSPDFNMTKLVGDCEQYNVRYLIVNEYGQNVTHPEKSFHYFNSTWTFYSLNQTLMDTGRFTYEPVHYWEESARIFILKFT